MPVTSSASETLGPFGVVRYMVFFVIELKSQTGRDRRNSGQPKRGVDEAGRPKSDGIR